MKIKHLKLTDFGPHKSLDIDLDSNIVGIVGPNGSGKSNLLQAINYALTGDLNKTNQVKYIRAFGTDNGAKKAVVELTFDKGGKEGKIIREIGATTSKRVLTWEGETYRKQEDVDRVLTGILSADKAVLTNAVFIKQGCIAEMVQGTPAERQDIFQKMMHLAFINKIDAELQSKQAQLNAGILDPTQQIAMLKEQITEAEVEYNALLKESDMLVKDTSLRTELEEYTRHVEAYSNALTLVASGQEDVLSLQDRLSVAKGESTVDELRKREGELTAVAQRGCTAENLLRKKEELDRAYIDAMVADNEASAELEEFNKEHPVTDVTALIKESGVLKEAIQWAKQEESVAELVRQAEKTMVEARTCYERACSDQRAAARHATRLEELSSLLKEYQAAMELCKIKRQLLEHGDGATCPCCGSVLDKDKISAAAVDAEWLALVEKAAAPKKEKEDIEKKMADAEATVLRTSLEYKAAEADLEHARLKYKDYQDWPYPQYPKVRDILELRLEGVTEAIAQNTSAQKERSRLKTNKAVAKTVLNTVASNKAALTDEMLKEDFFMATDAVLKEAVTAGRAVAEELQGVTDKLKEIERAQHALDVATANLKAHKAKVAEHESHIVVQEHSILDKYVSHLVDKERTSGASDFVFSEGSLTHVKKLNALYNAESGQYAALMDRMRDLDTSLEKNRQRMVDLQTLRSSNEKRLQLIRELQQVREVVGKNGAPRDYCIHVFNQITDVVQELLVQMGANFTVTPDLDRPLTYSFVRTDNDDGYEMSQERLSGGQAIRLALALLIACQRTVLPEVGLLVLDEPSSHIDAEGVANMRDMMMSLRQLLESADMQMILVDHNETLNAAFDRTIQLADLRK